MTGPFPEIILPKHLAIFGMTGSGKSTTGKDLVEQVVPMGSRVCILDTVKSDWWGITSSSDGKRPGLPFTILGGPHAHLPLSRNMGAAIAEVVASGAMPLSIIDMVDFGMGDAAHFFVDFAPVLMKKMRGVLYLIMEEAHEIAPKERVGFQKENMGVYWAKKLATAGRMRGIRLVVIDQRVQALHNAVIGSCETLVVHRQTAPADQKPVVDWLKGNVKDKDLRKQIEESMSSLEDGQAYLCSGAAKLFELVQFPRAKTFDNTAAPTDDSALKDVKTAKVDTESLRTILAEAVKEAEANDPAILRKRIAELEAKIGKPILAATPAAVSEALDKARAEAFLEGDAHGWDACKQAVDGALRSHAADHMDELHSHIDEYVKDLIERAQGLMHSPLPIPPGRRPANTLLPPKTVDKLLADGIALRSNAHPKGNGKAPPPDLNPASLETIEIDVPAAGVEKKILNVLAELEKIGAKSPPLELLALMTGYTHTQSKGFKKALSNLRHAELVEGLTLTAAGRAEAGPARDIRTAAQLQERVVALLGGATSRVLQPLLDAYPKPVDKVDLGTAAGYTHLQSKGFKQALSKLRSLGFIETRSGGVAAMPVLFLEHR